MRRLSAPLTLYRIADRRYPLYSGHAAGQVGFRWNPREIEVVYASVTYAGPPPAMSVTGLKVPRG